MSLLIKIWLLASGNSATNMALTLSPLVVGDEVYQWDNIRQVKKGVHVFMV
jgi:hypothetical protein